MIAKLISFRFIQYKKVFFQYGKRFIQYAFQPNECKHPDQMAAISAFPNAIHKNIDKFILFFMPADA